MQPRKAAAPLIVRAPLDVEGMTYQAHAVAPGMKFFGCDAYRATLSQTSCGERWRRAQTATGYDADRVSLCRGCPIGAQHAGEKPVIYSQHFKSPVCPRCRKGATRMIGDRMCISCYNRSRELAVGKNARGNTPVRLIAERPLHTVAFRLIVNGHSTRRSVPGVVDLLEPVLQTLRTTKGDVAFAFSPRSPLSQGRLF